MRHKGWMSTVAYISGLLALFFLVYSDNWLQWWPYVLIMYLMGGLTISVGYHRLFCHGAFQAHPFWHYAFTLYGILFLYGSPTQWSPTHATHHKWADTERDPHPKPATALWSKSYRNVPLELWVLRRLLRQGDFHRAVDSNYVFLWTVMVSVMTAVSWEVVLYAYLPAVDLAHLVGSLHNTTSHFGGKPRDWWFMEYLLLAGGEWLHASHHDNERRMSFRHKWYHLDPGAIVIFLIKTRKKHAVGSHRPQ